MQTHFNEVDLSLVFSQSLLYSRHGECKTCKLIRRERNTKHKNFKPLNTSSEEKKALYLSVKVFNTKALIGDTIFTSPTGDGNAILGGHPSHAKALPLAVQRD